MTPHDDQRIRQMFESAREAAESGRGQFAEQLLRQAEAEAPDHPLVQNRVASRMIMSGDPEGAQAVLARAANADPTNQSLWLNLATALRATGRADEEMAAIQHVLDMEPYNFRALMQKASLHETRNEPRAAAMAYRTALRTVPEGFEPPPHMRPVLQHARESVDANERALEGYLEDRLKDIRARHATEPQKRFDLCLATLLRKRRIFGQQPKFMYFPRLPAIEFYDREDFPWLDSIEAATDDIREECLNVLADGPEVLTPYVSYPEGVAGKFKELNHSRRWGTYFLWREGVAFPDHIARCPRTIEALKPWPRCDVPGSAPSCLFSILDARTRIPPHSGVSNTRLLVHLPLIVPPGCGFRSGAETREWVPGQAIVFDDTIEHEVWNDSDQPRAVMIFDIWSPFLSAAERDLVRETTTAVGEYYGIRTYDGD